MVALVLVLGRGSLWEPNKGGAYHGQTELRLQTFQVSLRRHLTFDSWMELNQTSTMTYHVLGGIWNPSFTEIVSDAEYYGPFDFYGDAYAAWQSSAVRNWENTAYRLSILEDPIQELPSGHKAKIASLAKVPKEELAKVIPFIKEPKRPYQEIRLNKVIARQGEAVTCTSGHKVLKLDMDIGARVVDSLRDYPARIGDVAQTCECGSPWARWFGTSIQLHFDDGWR